jgi:predicted metal-dependent hydrolase
MSELMPSEFWQGIEQFNSGQFYACHDTLEALWIEATEPEKTFYQGILQIAVALYHLGNRNLRGAMILLGEGSNRLRRYPSVFAGIDVDQLLEQSATLLNFLQKTDPEILINLTLGVDEALPVPKIIPVKD